VLSALARRVRICGVMSTSISVEQLRARAHHLRLVSAAIGCSRALTVYRLADTDTWVGPTPQACHDALIALRRQLQTNEQSLNDAARELEREADRLEQHQAIAAMAS
jgi:hypothetical protein